ncbi:8654_t:CDS:1 [Ambispora leptoticha]|uniref:8654_t:CDS:1 n=1 Tax=Ambispora leptoticha TaxID=144679 RepID=A0A9N9F692_9GLOM|nr:8654_t:CDS:1 [Ambispora leptoticha]
MECSLCKKPTNKCCSRCQAKYYCSPLCQKKDYTNHVLDCPPRSVDTLVKNVWADEMPTKIAVLYEYGFENCPTREDKINLLGLYIGLIKFLDCSASQIHSWWENGELPLNIKKAYDDAGQNSGYYQWFLKNEHFLQGLHKYEGEKSDKSIVDKYHAMVKPYLSEHEQTVSIKSLPESKRQVYSFYLIILIGCIPRIEHEIWIDFGFCSCKFGKDYLGESEEVRLYELYRELIVQKGCKIDEFHDAYVSGSVVDLLRKCDSGSWLSESRIEIPGYGQPTKSVYNLKQYALSESVDLARPVYADYGFMNCRTKEENRQLRNMYNKLVKTPQFDPRDLHEACVTGKIFNYVSAILPNEVVKKDLLRNVYPLKDLE